MKKYALAIFMLFALWCGGEKEGKRVEAGKMETEGKESVSFTLNTIYGEEFSLDKHKGKVIIINFWATWCPPCRAEIPSFVKLYREYAERGLVIVGISLDQGGNVLGKVRSFAENYDINYPIVIGNKDVVMKFGGIKAIPTTFVIDRDGKIVKKIVGYRNEEFFRSLIEELL
jgi:cytochrome c biogenesis protein CcmG/thiol:disulfide interchange protein DsbE